MFQETVQIPMDDDDGQYITASVAGISFSFMIDSGAGVNTITPRMFELLLTESSSELLNLSSRSDRTLKGYGCEKPLKVKATFSANLYIDEFRPSGAEKFYVVKNTKQALLSRRTALAYSVLRMGINVPLLSETLASVNTVLEKSVPFPSFNIPPVVLKVDPNVKPRRCTYTNIPFAWKDAAKKRIQEMVEMDIIEELTSDMDQSHCSAMLAVPKGPDDFRLVVDLRGPNECIIREPHKMPTFDSILAELHGSQYFSTIDLSNAFFHVQIAKESRHITNFFSGSGFFRFKRLPFGLCNAPDIFQSVMEQLLSGIDGVLIYLDDILIHARTKEEHDRIMKLVVNILENHGVKLNMKKCRFGRRSVKFLGFQISGKGYNITEDRLASIRNFRTPISVAEVRSFLGMLVFVDRFIFSRADKTQRLQQMVRDNLFTWDEAAQQEFDSLRNDVLLEIKKLGFFRQGDRTELVVDASPHGLGSVLVQFDDTGKSRIIACASKSLTKSEKNYPQVQREALAIVWAVERFQLFLRGQQFTVMTDNQGNEYIFGKTHKMGKRCITRAEAWALRLQPYNFKIDRVSGDGNIADVFSRLIKDSQIDEPFDDSPTEHILMIDSQQDLPITLEEVAGGTESDQVLQKVIKAVGSNDWSDSGIESYRRVKKDLSLASGVVFFRGKMVVPLSIQARTLRHGHRGHFGMGTMKRMLRLFVWWPKINQQIEELVGKCEVCQTIVHNERPIPLSSRPLPDDAWQRIQIDFLKIPDCGSGELLMVVDTFSRMVWAIEMRKSDTNTTIKALLSIFAVWGKPETIQSDNGPPFNSPAFTEYWKNQGVRHLTVVPLSPWMNGMVERCNEGIIKTIAAAKVEKGNWRTAVQHYVSTYNNSIPHSSTGATPFELMTGRLFRGCFPFPSNTTTRSKHSVDDIRTNDEAAKKKSTDYANTRRRAKLSEITQGDWVWVANKHRKNKLDSFYLQKKFVVTERNGARTKVEAEDGQTFERWVSDLKKTNGPDEDLSVGMEVTDRRKNRSEKAVPKEFLQKRYKVLMRQGNDLALRSEQGDERTADVDEVSRMDKFEWNDFSQPLHSDDSQASMQTPQPEPVVGRPKRVLRKPARLEDFELFNVFG